MLDWVGLVGLIDREYAVEMGNEAPAQFWLLGAGDTKWILG